MWAKDPEIAGELLEELAKQERSRRATLRNAAKPYASSIDQMPFTGYESTATVNYINAGTQTSVDFIDAAKPRAQRRKPDDLVYRPSHSSSKSTRWKEKTQRDDAENEPTTSQPEIPSPKSPGVVEASINGGTRDEDFAAVATPEPAFRLGTPVAGLCMSYSEIHINASLKHVSIPQELAGG